MAHNLDVPILDRWLARCTAYSGRNSTSNLFDLEVTRCFRDAEVVVFVLGDPCSQLQNALLDPMCRLQAIL